MLLSPFFCTRNRELAGLVMHMEALIKMLARIRNINWLFLFFFRFNNSVVNMKLVLQGKMQHLCETNMNDVTGEAENRRAFELHNKNITSTYHAEYVILLFKYWNSSKNTEWR